ncbi:MAG TPA: GTP 3',8-cyclase MoaA [Euzebyales bacterium]
MPKNTSAAPRDRLRRPLRDLRVSITDRCNFRCTYCMPRELFGPDHQFLPRAELLSFEEIARVVRVLADLGVRKVRLTGGEPLVRRDVTELIAMLDGIDGIDDLAMTTNGSLLAPLADDLRAAGLRRLTISLDALDDEVFRAMSDTRTRVDVVLDGIAAAEAAGFAPIKVNAVVRGGVNTDQIVPLARYGREHGLIVRFIEFMDVGTTNGWQLGEVVPSRDVIRTIDAVFPVEPLDPNYAGEVAQRWRYRDGAGEVGVISSVSQPFCSTCTRARLSAIGELYTCLFASGGTDVRAWLRSGLDDDELRERLAEVWRGRSDRYSELRTRATADLDKVEMSYIGG